MDAERIALAEHLVTTTNLPIEQIGRRLGVTKNTIMGLRHRRGWLRPDESAKPEPPIRTTNDRLDALHAAMDQVLETTRPVITRIRRLKAEAARARRPGIRDHRYNFL